MVAVKGSTKHFRRRSIDRFGVRGFVEGDRGSVGFGDRSPLVQTARATPVDLTPLLLKQQKFMMPSDECQR
jgi:hypothetical protein